MNIFVLTRPDGSFSKYVIGEDLVDKISDEKIYGDTVKINLNEIYAPNLNRINRQNNTLQFSNSEVEDFNNPNYVLSIISVEGNNFSDNISSITVYASMISTLTGNNELPDTYRWFFKSNPNLTLSVNPSFRLSKTALTSQTDILELIVTKNGEAISTTFQIVNLSLDAIESTKIIPVFHVIGIGDDYLINQRFAPSLKRRRIDVLFRHDTKELKSVLWKGDTITPNANWEVIRLNTNINEFIRSGIQYGSIENNNYKIRYNFSRDKTPTVILKFIFTDNSEIEIQVNKGYSLGDYFKTIITSQPPPPPPNGNDGDDDSDDDYYDGDNDSPDIPTFGDDDSDDDYYDGDNDSPDIPTFGDDGDGDSPITPPQNDDDDDDDDDLRVGGQQ